MRSSLSRLLLLLLTAVALRPSSGQEAVDISVGDGGITVDIQGFADPCEDYACAVGQECVAIYHPSLLPFPVAHCSQIQGYQPATSGPCVQWSVGSNVLNCRTEEEWRAVGERQCLLRSDPSTPRRLDHTEVAHACHSFTGGNKFLLATFTCCLEQETVTMATSEALSSTESKVPPKYTAVKDPPLSRDDEPLPAASYRNYIVPMAIGGAALMAIIVLALAIRHRCRSKAASRKGSQPDFSTSFVNHSCEGWEGGGGGDSCDGSLLIGATPSSK